MSYHLWKREVYHYEQKKGHRSGCHEHNILKEVLPGPGVRRQSWRTAAVQVKNDHGTKEIVQARWHLIRHL